MSYQTADRILETTTTTGTGAITMLGAVGGYRAFSSVITANGDQFPYVIAAGTEWEVGIGTRTGATTFTRSPTASSNAGALVSFSAGTKEVWIDWTDAHITSMRARNIIINGGMEISQESVATAQTAISAAKYIVDMFQWNPVGAGVVTLQQVADAPSGFKYSAKVSVTTADASMAATDKYVIYAAIEAPRIARLGFGAAGASAVSLGYWVKAHRTGTYSGSLINNLFNRSYPFEYAVNAVDTWEYKTVTISGDTAGTWTSAVGTAGLYVSWAMALGSNFTQAAGAWAAAEAEGTANQVNAMAATTDTFQITGVTLIAGVVPVSERQSSSHAMRPFDEELTLCMRYYEKTFDYATVPAQNAGVNLGEFSWAAVKAGAVSQRAAVQVRFRVLKRVGGNRTYYNPSAANAFARDVDSATDCTATATVTSGQAGFHINVTPNASTAVGNMMAVHWVTDARF
jgi:hypothetical protein